jgi:hypothetical protein
MLGTEILEILVTPFLSDDPGHCTWLVSICAWLGMWRYAFRIDIQIATLPVQITTMPNSIEILLLPY